MDSTDRAFLRATYPDPSWPTMVIAAKLDIPLPTVYAEARRMGLPVAPDVRTPRFDWHAAWRKHGMGISLVEIGNTLGVTAPAVGHAVKRMRAMTEEERAAHWKRYERAYDAGLFD